SRRRDSRKNPARAAAPRPSASRTPARRAAEGLAPPRPIAALLWATLATLALARAAHVLAHDVGMVAQPSALPRSAPRLGIVAGGRRHIAAPGRAPPGADVE